MSEQGDVGLQGLWAEDESFAERRHPRTGAVIAGLVALAASAALAWWIATPDRSPPPPAPEPAPAVAASAPPEPLRYAPEEPDPGQVKLAYGDVQTAFSQAGAQALVQGSIGCAKAVAADPRRLDYCLAYDTYAAVIVRGALDAAAQADWFSGAGDRDLSLARSALPLGVDAGNRLEQVAALTSAVLPKPKPPPEAHPVRHRRHAKPAQAKPVHAKAIHAKTVHLRKARPAHPKRAKPLTAPSHTPARAASPAAEEDVPAPWDDEIPPH